MDLSIDESVLEVLNKNDMHQMRLTIKKEYEEKGCSNLWQVGSIIMRTQKYGGRIMPTIQDYMSGRICEQVKSALSTLETSDDSLKDTEVGINLLNKVNEAAPKKLSTDEAVILIRESHQCAIGERVCRSLHMKTLLTETVFLDELAAGMVEAGKARFVSKNEAVNNIMKYRKQPIIVSKVSGKYSEICPTWAKKCLFWNMEKHKLKCIIR